MHNKDRTTDHQKEQSYEDNTDNSQKYLWDQLDKHRRTNIVKTF